MYPGLVRFHMQLLLQSPAFAGRCCCVEDQAISLLIAFPDYLSVAVDAIKELYAQGWIIFRSREYLPENLVFHDSYLGIDQISFTLNFSKRCVSVDPYVPARDCPCLLLACCLVMCFRGSFCLA